MQLQNHDHTSEFHSRTLRAARAEDTVHARPGAARPMLRRGNTIVLAAAILVLLVIIATAFVTRSQNMRTTSRAVQFSQQRDDKVGVIRDELAQMIANALFLYPVARPVPMDASGVLVVEADYPRWDAGRVGLPAAMRERFAVDPLTPYNYAPYEVVPFTNWPDPSYLGAGFAAMLPPGPGNLNGGSASPLLLNEWNPVGAPGFGDFRPLRDNEPQRFDANGDGVPDHFSHWRHMTYLAKPNNGLRVIRDMADVFDTLDNFPNSGGLVDDLDIPLEQWIVGQVAGASANPDVRVVLERYNNNANFPIIGDSRFNPGSGPFANDSDFVRWLQWTNPLIEGTNYFTNYFDPMLVPSNYVRLSDLNADGIQHNFGDAPSAEFIPGAARNLVSRYLTDTDGDGYTDAIWHLAPLSSQDGVRYAIAVSILDNAGMANINIAQKAEPRLTATTNLQSMLTYGITPADAALVGQNNPNLAPNNVTLNYHIGLLDNPANWFRHWSTSGSGDVVWQAGRWQEHLAELGVRSTGPPLTQLERLSLWQELGLSLGSMSFSELSPYTMSDELELRANAGNNYQMVISRLEDALSTAYTWGGQNYQGILHSGLHIEGGSEWGADRLRNEELVRTLRNKLTTYNATRNETLPPWLWYREFVANPVWDSQWPRDFQLSGVDIDYGDFDVPPDYPYWQQFIRQSKLKLDLREPEYGAGVPLGSRDPFVPIPLYERDPNGVPIAFVLDPAVDQRAGRLAFRDRLPLALLLAMTEGGTDGIIGGNDATSYVGNYQGSPARQDLLCRISGAFASNILAQRTPWGYGDNSMLPNATTLGDVVVPPRIDMLHVESSNDDLCYLGLEKQPFLVEAFLAHVHGSDEVPLGGDPLNECATGNYVDEDHEQTTILVVQLANPFDEPISLDGFSVRAFGNKFELPDEVIPASTEDRPSTVIIYSIAPTFNNNNPNYPSELEMRGEFRARWFDFLDIENNDLPPFTLLLNATGVWSTDRDDYDSWNASGNEPAIGLYRAMANPLNPALLTDVDVLVDRFDHDAASANQSEFAKSVVELTVPPDREDFLDPVSGLPLPAGIRIDSSTVWLTFVHVTRAWGYDRLNPRHTPPMVSDCQSMDGGRLSATERSPRYIFSVQQVVTPGERNDMMPEIGSEMPVWQDGGGGTGECVDDELRGFRYDDSTTRDLDDDPWFEIEWDPYFNDTDADPCGNVRDPNRLRKPFAFSNNIVWDTNGVDALYPDFATSYLGTPQKFRFYDWKVVTPQNPGDPEPVYPFPDDAFPDTTNVALDMPLQMLQKDGDFVRIGELLNVWLFGHELEMTGGTNYVQTTRCFSEWMAYDARNGFPPHAAGGVFVNRLKLDGDLLGVPENNQFDDPRHSMAVQTAGQRVLDLFTLDHGGFFPDLGNLTQAANQTVLTPNPNGNFTIDPLERERMRFGLSNGFSGAAIHGLININTAPLEVLRMIPNWYKLVARVNTYDPDGPVFAGADPQGPRLFADAFAHPNAAMEQGLLWTRSALPEATIQFRERYSGTSAFGVGYFDGPDYSNRGPSGPPRGFATPSDLLSLSKVAGSPLTDPWPTQNGAEAANRLEFIPEIAWNIGYAGATPFLDSNTGLPASTDLSTDLNFIDETGNPLQLYPDRTSADAEEQAMLFASAANMVSTRSDTFTVYFRVRAFRQNPITQVWNAMDPEYIVDDSRYVMLIDRSNCNTPEDKPRILYFEKLPN